MPLSTKFLKQRCVYWAWERNDDHGQPVHCPPREIDCRWDDVEDIVILPNGDQKRSMAQVMVGEELTKKGMLLFQTLDKVKCLDDPRAEGALEIITQEQYPNLKATDTVRIVKV